MDDARVLQACRLLHEALYDDLELRLEVDRDRVSITIHQKRGTQEKKVIIGEVHPRQHSSARREAVAPGDRGCVHSYCGRFINSGDLAILMAMRRASSCVRRLAARRPGSFS
jgi:hypothetical protein